VSGSGVSWAICKSAPCPRQITTPAPHHSVSYSPSWRPTNSVKAQKANNNDNDVYCFVLCQLTLRKTTQRWDTRACWCSLAVVTWFTGHISTSSPTLLSDCWHMQPVTTMSPLPYHTEMLTIRLSLVPLDFSSPFFLFNVISAMAVVFFLLVQLCQNFWITLCGKNEAVGSVVDVAPDLLRQV